MTITRRALLAGAAAVLAIPIDVARAATVTLIVPYPPGGAVDILGRLIADKLGPRLGGEVVVENRGGAGGNIGAAAVANSPPERPTFGLLAVTQLIVNKYLFKSMPFDPDADLTPISRVATGTIICVANAERARERGWKSLRDMIAWSKANPDQVRMGSSGVGTISHLGVELVKSKTGASILHVPYKGGAPALVDCLAGVVDIMFDVIPALAGPVRDGKLVALGVGSKERVRAFPDTPSMKDFSDIGLGEVDIATWYAIVGAKAMDPEARDAAHRALTEAMVGPEVKAKLEPLGFSPVVDASPEELSKRIADENPYWRDLVKLSGATLE